MINVQEFLAAAMDQSRSSIQCLRQDCGGTISNDDMDDESTRVVKELEGQLVSMEVAESCELAIQRELEQTGNSDDLDFEQPK
mmetsp:Transcript_21578/g.45052  ORF Transcript_21578/g.45052 Transcript_21578/m.45052 type:complete len:83 (+) Transcript_21578:106-354(+)